MWPNVLTPLVLTTTIDVNSNYESIKVGNLLQIEENIFKIVHVKPNEVTIQALKANNGTFDIRTFVYSDFDYIERMIENTTSNELVLINLTIYVARIFYVYFCSEHVFMYLLFLNMFFYRVLLQCVVF